MVTFADTPRLTLPIAPVGAGLAALLAAAICVALPAWRLESLVASSGLPALLAAAEPPLGWTARGTLALAGGVLVALVVWAALHLWIGRRRVRVRLPVLALPAKHGPSVRRADAHPDAPPRAPILAQLEFGRPISEVPTAPRMEAERPLPTDLATPLAGYEPDAISPAPRAPAILVRPTPLAPGERIETFELAHDVPPEHAHSIESLLARLERGARARGFAWRDESLAPPSRVATGA